MALKDLLVYVDQTEDSLVRLRLAVDLAVRNDSRLTAIFVREWNRDQLDLRKAAELGLVSAAGFDSLDRRIETSIDAVAERLRSTLETLARKHGLAAELRCVDGVASVVLPQHARYADLCILGHDQPEGPASVNYTFAEQLLFVTGRPVFFVPPLKSPETLGRHIVVAWNASRPRRDRSTTPTTDRAGRADDGSLDQFSGHSPRAWRSSGREHRRASQTAWRRDGRGPDR